MMSDPTSDPTTEIPTVPSHRPPRKSRKRLWLTIAGVVVALFVIIGVSTGGKTPAPVDTASAPAAPAALPAAPAPAVVAPAAPPAAAAPAGPLTTFGPGDYLVGTDVAAGTYRSPGVLDSIAPLCYWVQKNPDGSIVLGQQGAKNSGPSRATLKAGLTFETTGCEPWVKTG